MLDVPAPSAPSPLREEGTESSRLDLLTFRA